MRIIITYIFVVLSWGSTWYAITLQLGSTAPEWSIAIRFSFASLLLFVWCVTTKRRIKLDFSEHKTIALLGLLMFSTNYIFVYTGTVYLTSGLVAVAFSLLTVLNIINARIFLKTPVEKTILLGALFGIVGLIMIFWPEIDRLSLANEATYGLILCLTSTFLASLGNTVTASKRVNNIPLASMTAWAMLYGSTITVLYALGTGKEFIFEPRPSYWWSLIYLSIVGSVIAFTLYFWLIKKIGVARSAYTAVLIPIVALTVSTFAESYVWTSASAGGLALVIFGNIVMIQRKGKKPVIVEA